MFGLFKSKKKSAKAKILIVDDEPDYVTTVQCRLEWYGYKVVTATNGKEGLEKAASERPDLILLDTCMPVMNGHEMLERIRQRQGLKDTVVLMVTAVCEEEDIAIASSYGIADYIAKPFDFTELLKKITNALENRETFSNA